MKQYQSGAQVKAKNFLLSLFTFLLIHSHGYAQVISYWNFNTLTNSALAPETIAATSGLGAGTLFARSPNANATLIGSGTTGVTSFGGTTNNAQSGDTAGQALAIQGNSTGGGSTTDNNGKYLTFTANTTSASGITVSFSTQKTSTGFSSNKLQYSTTGLTGTFVDFATYNPNTSTSGANGFQTQTFNLSAISGLDNNSVAAFRILFDGATAGAGNNRIDNLVVSANVVPEPGSMLLVGVTCLSAFAWRRFRTGAKVPA